MSWFQRITKIWFLPTKKKKNGKKQQGLEYPGRRKGEEALGQPAPLWCKQNKGQPTPGTLAPGPLNHKGTHCLANDGHLLAVLGLPALPCLRALKSKLFIYTVTLGSGSHCYELICIEEVTEVSELGATVFQ